MKKFFIKVKDLVKYYASLPVLKGGLQLAAYWIIASLIVGALVFWYHYPNVKLGFWGL